MSRSVSTHDHAIATVYLDASGVLDSEASEWAWYDFIDDLRDVLTGSANVDSGLLINKKPFTGFEGYECASRWSGRENKVILEGELTEISISEYNHLVAVCLAPLNPDEPSHRHACEHAAPYFNALLKAAYPKSFLKKIGTFSNGESIYERQQAA